MKKVLLLSAGLLGVAVSGLSGVINTYDHTFQVPGYPYKTIENAVKDGMTAPWICQHMGFTKGNFTMIPPAVHCLKSGGTDVTNTYDHPFQVSGYPYKTIENAVKDGMTAPWICQHMGFDKGGGFIPAKPAVNCA